MRIAVVCKNRISKTATFIRDHLDGLDHEITTIVGRPISINDNYPGILSRTFHFFVRKIAETGIVEVDTIYDIIYSLLLWWMKPDVVLAQFATSGAKVLNACQRNNLKIVVYCRGYDLTKNDVVNRHKDIYVRLFDYASAIICVSESLRKVALSLGGDKETTFVNPSGADTVKFQPPTENGFQRRFISVGRFTSKKAPYITLLAFRKVLDELSCCNLTMIGNGPLLESSKDLAKVLGMMDSVEFLGSKTHSVVAKEMQEADVYVQHSIESISGDSEGAPVSIMEAGAAGLPVISTKHAGIPEIVINGRTGFLVDEGSIEGMSSKMIELMDHPECVLKLGLNARARVEKYFSHKVTISRLSMILEWVGSRSVDKPPLVPKYDSR